MCYFWIGKNLYKSIILIYSIMAEIDIPWWFIIFMDISFTLIFLMILMFGIWYLLAIFRIFRKNYDGKYIPKNMQKLLLVLKLGSVLFPFLAISMWFMCWYDIACLTRDKFYSAWVYPIYIWIFWTLISILLYSTIKKKTLWN